MFPSGEKSAKAFKVFGGVLLHWWLVYVYSVFEKILSHILQRLSPTALLSRQKFKGFLAKHDILQNLGTYICILYYILCLPLLGLGVQVIACVWADYPQRCKEQPIFTMPGEAFNQTICYNYPILWNNPKYSILNTHVESIILSQKGIPTNPPRTTPVVQFCHAQDAMLTWNMSYLRPSYLRWVPSWSRSDTTRMHDNLVSS
jgi:hypothetical protein